MHGIHLAPVQRHDADIFLIQLVFHIRRFAFCTRHHRRSDDDGILAVQPQHRVFAQRDLVHPPEHMIAGSGHDHHDVFQFVGKLGFRDFQTDRHAVIAHLYDSL